VPRVRDEEDHALQPEIAPLAGHGALERLDIVEMCLDFDEEGSGKSVDDAVGATPITVDGHGDFGAHRQPGAKSHPEPLEQGEMPLVANGRSIRMEPDAELQPENRCKSGGELDRQRPWVSALSPSNTVVTYAEAAGDLAATQAARPSSIGKAARCAFLKVATAPGTAFRCRLSIGLGPRLVGRSHPPIIRRRRVCTPSGALRAVSKPCGGFRAAIGVMTRQPWSGRRA
jgi:hypothetical protein